MTQRSARSRTALSTLSILVPGLIVLATWLVLLVTPALDWGGDSALYLIHAQNLVSGMPYNLSGYIQNPAAYLSPQSYPPGFALLLAPAVAFFGLDVHALKLCIAALLVLTFAILALWIRDDFARYGQARLFWAVAVGLAAFNPLLIDLLLRLGADGAFLMSAYAALFILDRLYHQPDNASYRAYWAMIVGAGLLVALAAATRVFGLLLFAVIPLFELLRYRRFTSRGMAALSIGLVVYGLVRLAITLDSVTIARGSAGGYGHLFVNGLWNNALAVPARMVAGLYEYAYLLSQFLVLQWPWATTPTSTTPAQLVATFVGILLGLAGFVIQCRRRASVREVFFVIYALALLPWLAQSARYLAPLIPLFFFYVMLVLAAMFGQRRWSAIGVCGLVAALGATMYSTRYEQDGADAAQVMAEAPNGPAAQAMYRYIQRHTPSNSVIAYRKPRIVALFTNRRAITFSDAMNPMPPAPDMLLFLADNHIDYLLTDTHTSDPALAGFIAGHRPDPLSLIHHTAHFTLYRVDHDASGA